MRCKSYLLLLSLMSGSAHAFNTVAQFVDPPGIDHVASFSASAEGIYFTGAPRFAAQTCAACHIEGPRTVGLHLGAEPASLFTDGYVSGQVYQLQVKLINENKGLQYNSPICTQPPSKNDKYTYIQCNNNNFVAEIDTAAGPLSGTSVFCASPFSGTTCQAANPSTDEVVVAPQGDAVFGNQPHFTVPGMEKFISQNGQTSWSFYWKAPSAGAGPLALYVAAVDGNGGAGTGEDDEGPYDDDTVSAAVTLKEAGAALGFDAHAGCAFAGPPGDRSLFLSLLLGLSCVLRRAWRVHKQ